MERGVRSGDPSRGDMRGLRDLLDRLRDRRREVLGEGTLTDPLADVRRRARRDRGPRAGRGPAPARRDRAGLRAGTRGRRSAPGPAGAPDPELQRMLRGIAAKRLDSLDALPPDVGARVRALQDYDFLDGDGPRAGSRSWSTGSGKSVLDRMTQGLADAVRSMTPEELEPQPRDGPGPQRPPRAPARRATSRRRTRSTDSWPGTARSSRARARSTTSWSSSRSGWRRCSR